jgi:endonuclease YncB( thermonuclease family)
MRQLLAALAVVVAALGGSHVSGAAVEASTGVVASVYDGDTLTLTTGQRIRLLQIDTPELGSGEC